MDDFSIVDHEQSKHADGDSAAHDFLGFGVVDADDISALRDGALKRDLDVLERALEFADVNDESRKIKCAPVSLLHVLGTEIASDRAFIERIGREHVLKRPLDQGFVEFFQAGGPLSRAFWFVRAHGRIISLQSPSTDWRFGFWVPHPSCSWKGGGLEFTPFQNVESIPHRSDSREPTCGSKIKTPTLAKGAGCPILPGLGRVGGLEFTPFQNVESIPHRPDSREPTYGPRIKNPTLAKGARMGHPNPKTQTNFKGEITRLMYTFQSHTAIPIAGNYFSGRGMSENYDVIVVGGGNAALCAAMAARAHRAARAGARARA